MCPQMPPASADVVVEVDVVATMQSDAAQVGEAPVSQTIDCLPDLPMLTIFRHIPLFDLLTTMPQVSPRLANLKAEAARQRTSLTVILGEGADSQLDAVTSMFPDLPPIDTLSKMVFRQASLRNTATFNLTGSLPNITSLTMVLNRKEAKAELCEVISLLCAWAHQLTDLVLVIGNTSDILTLQPAINRLSRLRHLTLYFPNDLPLDFPSISTDDDASPFDLPIMAHLVSFNCHFPKLPYLFVSSLARYFADNTRARSIDFGSVGFEYTDDFLALPPAIGRLFKRLHFIYAWPLDQLPRLSLAFPCLTFLELDLYTWDWPAGPPYSLPLIAAPLRSLTCLTELHLWIADRTAYGAPQGEDAEEVLLPAEPSLAALPSVTSLSLFLGIPFRSHQDLLTYQLEKMLPNLEKFLIDGPSLDCLLCHLTSSDNCPHDEMGRRVACAEQVFAPIRPLFARLELAQVGFNQDDESPTIITLT